MFDFIDMTGTYDERKVDRYEHPSGFVSTVRVTDSPEQPYETAISYDVWGKDDITVVQTYVTKQEAKSGHNIYVKMMEDGTLPREIPRDMSLNIWSTLVRTIEDAIE